MSKLYTVTKQPSITIIEGVMKLNIPFKDILFIQAEHVYIRLHLVNNQQLLHRISLGAFIKKLPQREFVQVHRSFVINKKQVNHWNNGKINIQGRIIPISRSRRKTVNQYLLA